MNANRIAAVALVLLALVQTICLADAKPKVREPLVLPVASHSRALTKADSNAIVINLTSDGRILLNPAQIHRNYEMSAPGKATRLEWGDALRSVTLDELQRYLDMMRTIKRMHEATSAKASGAQPGLLILVRADKDALLLHVKYLLEIAAECRLRAATGIAVTKWARPPCTREEARILGWEWKETGADAPSMRERVLILTKVHALRFLDPFQADQPTLRVRIVADAAGVSARYTVGARSAGTAAKLSKLLAADLKRRKASKHPVEAAMVSGDDSTRFKFAVAAYDRLLGSGVKQFVGTRIAGTAERHLRQLPGAR